MFLDNEVYDMYIRYVGRETIKTKYGKFKAIKIKPLLIKGTIFEGGEKMTVWVTDDPNHIPVRIESPIVVGKVKVDMMGYENLRHPLTSLIKQAALNFFQFKKIFWSYSSFGLLQVAAFIYRIMFKEKDIIIFNGFFQK